MDLPHRTNDYGNGPNDPPLPPQKSSWILIRMHSSKLRNSIKWLDVVDVYIFPIWRFSTITLWQSSSKFRFLWGNIALNSSLQLHGVWKSQKKSHSTLRAKRATFTFWVDKSWLKMPKMIHFGEFLKTWSLRSNRVTRHVTFNRTKIGGKCQNSKIQMRHFEQFSNNVSKSKVLPFFIICRSGT